MTPVLSALGIDADGESSLDFEAQFPTGLRGTPPQTISSTSRAPIQRKRDSEGIYVYRIEYLGDNSSSTWSG